MAIKQRKKAIMNKYTQKQETEIVRDAMTLTTAIQIGEEELSKQKSKQFKSKPAAPLHKILEVPKAKVQMPPEPKSDYSFTDHLKANLIWVIIFFPVFLLYIAFAYFQYTTKKREIEEELKHSDANYLKSLDEAKKKAEAEQKKINEEIAQKQAEIDAKYKSDLEHYNNVILPEYNREYDAWKIAQKLKIELLEEELQLNKETLDALYTSTNIISNRYRTLEILKWLYDELSSSDITFERAIDLYNAQSLEDHIKGMGGQIAAAINDMHSSMISGFNSVYEAVEAGNEELAKTRRDQNLANTAGIIQRHNLNKMVKNQNGMLDKYFNQ